MRRIPDPRRALPRKLVVAGILISGLIFASAAGLFLLGARAYDAERVEAELAARKVLESAVEAVASGFADQLEDANSIAEKQLRGEESPAGTVSELILLSPEGRILLPRLNAYPPLAPPPESEKTLVRKYMEEAAREYAESGEPLDAVPFVEEAMGDFDHPDLFASLALETARYYTLGERHDRARFLVGKLIDGLEGARDLDGRPASLQAALMFLSLPGEDPRDREAVASRAAAALADHAFGFPPPRRRQALAELAPGFPDGSLPERILTRLSFVDALEYRLVPEATRVVETGSATGWRHLHVRGPAGELVLGWRPETEGMPHVVGYRLDPEYFWSSIQLKAFQAAELHGVRVSVDTVPGIEFGDVVPGGPHHSGGLAPGLSDLRVTATARPPLTPHRLRVIHIGMSLLLVLGLAMGLWLSLRAVSGERETARVKQHFIDNVSHELRTPLTSIRMYAEMLEEEPDLPEEKKDRYHALILRESERLSRLVEDVLDFSRVARGEALQSAEAVRPADLVREALDLWAPQTEEAGFSVVVDMPEDLPRVLADRDSAVRGLSNLLGNAIRYSGESREVRISGSLEGDQVHLLIRDRGPGIPEEARERLFERFYRAPRDARRAKGVGLGLVLAREIARSQGGDVFLVESSERGSAFALALPIEEEAA